jgi:hypothetical protein
MSCKLRQILNNVACLAISLFDCDIVALHSGADPKYPKLFYRRNEHTHHGNSNGFSFSTSSARLTGAFKQTPEITIFIQTNVFSSVFQNEFILTLVVGCAI